MKMVALLIIIAVAGVLFLIFSDASRTACTFELNICPNGRAVGRVGPNCEYAPCELPGSTDECNAKTGFWRQWCYRDYAAEVTVNPRLCGEIDLSSVRNSCYREISYKADNPAMCEDFSQEFKDSCIVTVSKNSNEVELCEKLSGEAADMEIGQCYRNIAVNRLDESLCNKAAGLRIGSFDSKYLCLLGIALKRKDSDFCTKLDSLGFSETFYPSNCQAAFSNSQ